MGLKIRIKELQLNHVSGSKLSCEIQSGELIGITGPNGAGKTELLRYISGLRRTKTMGEIVINGLDPFHARDLEKLHGSIGFALQSPEDTMVFSSIPRDAAFGPENHAVEPDIIRKRWEGLRSRLLADIPEGQRFETLSGGQKQRAALVSVLMLRSPLLLLDEPLSMLGEDEGREVLSLILALAKRNKQTVLLVSHDQKVLSRMDRVFLLKDGKLREKKQPGATGEETTEDSSYSAGEFNAEEEDEEYEDNSLDDVGGKNPVNPYPVKRQTRGPDWIVRKTPDSVEPLVTMRDVSFRYGKNQVLEGVSLDISPGGIYLISGGTGFGKSTLCKLMNGTLAATGGRIQVGKIRLPLAREKRKWSLFSGKKPVPMAEVRRFVGYAMQYPEDQLFESTVRQDVMYGPLRAGLPTTVARQHAEEALRALSVPERLWDRKPEKLSGGEQRRVALAGILAMKPKVLVLDEPFAGLDPKGKRIVKDLIKDYVNHGRAVVITTHEAKRPGTSER